MLESSITDTIATTGVRHTAVLGFATVIHGDVQWSRELQALKCHWEGRGRQVGKYACLQAGVSAFDPHLRSCRQCRPSAIS